MICVLELHLDLVVVLLGRLQKSDDEHTLNRLAVLVVLAPLFRVL